MDLVKDYLMSSDCHVFQGVFTSICSHSRKNQFCADGKTNPLAFSLCSSASAVRWIYRKNVNRCCSLPCIYKEIKFRENMIGWLLLFVSHSVTLCHSS